MSGCVSVFANWRNVVKQDEPAMTMEKALLGGASATRRGVSGPDRLGNLLRRHDLLVLPLYGGFLLLILLPLSLVLLQAVIPGLFDPKGASFVPSLAPIIDALSSSRVLSTTSHSIELAAGGAVTSTLLGGALALLVGRFDLPGRQFAAFIPWVVFLTPSYVRSLAWVLLMSPAGYLVELGLISPGFARAFFSLSGLIFVQTISLFPLASFIIGNALKGLGREYEDAARLAGAGPVTVWAKVNLPLLAPAIALSLIAIFAEGLSDFGMAATIARNARFELLTYGIYAATSDYPVDFPLAGTQALILLALVVAAVATDRLLRRRADPRIISGRSRVARRQSLGRWKAPAILAVAALTLVAVILPLGAIFVRALTRTIGFGVHIDNFTFDNILNVLTLGTAAGQALGRSFAYGASASLIACAIALLLAMELDRSRKLMRPLILALSLGTVAIPGIVLAFGYILMWNRLPGFRDWPFPHYGEPSLLVTGYVAASLPYCLVIILSAIGQLSPNLSDAARLHGAERMRRLIGITLPLTFLSIVTALLFTFIHTLFELPLSQLLIPRSGPPMPTYVVGLFDNENEALGSALSLVSMIAAGGLAGLLWAIASRLAPRRSSEPQHGDFR